MFFFCYICDRNKSINNISKDSGTGGKTNLYFHHRSASGSILLYYKPATIRCFANLQLDLCIVWTIYPVTVIYINKIEYGCRTFDDSQSKHTRIPLVLLLLIAKRSVERWKLWNKWFFFSPHFIQYHFHSCYQINNKKLNFNVPIHDKSLHTVMIILSMKLHRETWHVCQKIQFFLSVFLPLLYLSLSAACILIAHFSLCLLFCHFHLWNGCFVNCENEWANEFVGCCKWWPKRFFVVVVDVIRANILCIVLFLPPFFFRCCVESVSSWLDPLSCVRCMRKLHRYTCDPVKW